MSDVLGFFVLNIDFQAAQCFDDRSGTIDFYDLIVSVMPDDWQHISEIDHPESLPVRPAPPASGQKAAKYVG